jgi:hypothetical protein
MLNQLPVVMLTHHRIPSGHGRNRPHHSGGGLLTPARIPTNLENKSRLPLHPFLGSRAAGHSVSIRHHLTSAPSSEVANARSNVDHGFTHLGWACCTVTSARLCYGGKVPSFHASQAEDIVPRNRTVVKFAASLSASSAKSAIKNRVREACLAPGWLFQKEETSLTTSGPTPGLRGGSPGRTS